MVKSKNKRKEKNKSHIPFRLNFLFFIVFLLFVGLIMRSGYLQIIQGQEFQAEVDRTESTVIRGNVPRGEIYDSDLTPLVANDAKNTIMYTRGSNTKTENMAEVAYNLANLIDIPHASPFQGDDEDVSMRDLRDYFYAQNTELMEDRIDAHLAENAISADDFSYTDSLNLISEAELIEYTDHDLKAAAIFTKMNSAYALSTVNIKSEDTTQDEIARVSEHSLLLPGVSTGTDWDRTYPQGDTLRSVLGSVSSEDQGLPESQVNEYLARGYSRNDRVGRSQIESQYENVLRGSKSRARTETDSSGDILTQEEVYPGKKGDSLVLTIDMDFQERMDQIVTDIVNDRRGLNDSAYAIAMDPNDGSILAMSGKKANDNGEINDNTLGVTQNAFEMGSSVKGATILAGYMDGVLTPENNNIIDTPMEIQSSQNISSVFNRSGTRMMNDITALQYSSNVYMTRLAMRMGGYWNYEQNETVPINPKPTLRNMRTYYRQFGLGTSTGIDLPSESTGLSRTENLGVENALFQSFGQFDTYTLMQLAQYSSTLANGGTRYAPKLVSEVRETNSETGEVGRLAAEVEPKVMNHVNATDEQFDRVQQGFNLVVNGDYGFAPGIFADAPYQAAGKTGTAEAVYYNPESSEHNTSVTNLSFVGYAPYDDPEIAIAVVIPYLPNEDTGTNHVEMSRQIFDAYFEVGEFESSEDENEDEENTEE